MSDLNYLLCRLKHKSLNISTSLIIVDVTHQLDLKVDVEEVHEGCTRSIITIAPEIEVKCTPIGLGVRLILFLLLSLINQVV